MVNVKSYDFREGGTRTNTLSNNFDLSLVGTCGVPDMHECAPKSIEIRNGQSSSLLGKAFLEVYGQDFVKYPIGATEAFFPVDFFEGLDHRGYGEPCTTLVICPVRADRVLGESHAAGFIVLGVNPKRPFDENYKLFIQLLTRQLITTLSTILLNQKERYENELLVKKVIVDKTILTEQLAQQTNQTLVYEQQLARITEFSPFGIHVLNKEGDIVYVNDSWYDIVQYPRGLPLSEW